MTLVRPAAFEIDAFAEETGVRILVGNMEPFHGEEDVVVTTPVKLHVFDTGPAPNMPATVLIWINGVLAYDGAGFVPPWHLGSSVSKVPSPLSPVNDLWKFVLGHFGWPWSSEELVEVRVYAQSTAGYDIDFTYSFRAADIIKPEVQAVVCGNPRRIDVTFNEPVDAATVVPAAFGIAGADAPYFLPGIASVEAISSSRYFLHLDSELSNGRSYVLHVAGVQDDGDPPNVIDPVDVPFASASYWTDPRRRFRLWDWVPGRVRWADRMLTGHSPGHTEQFIAALQEIFDLWLLDVDADAFVFDVDQAPEGAIDLLLEFLHNPFRFVMTGLQKRKLLSMLPTVNASKHGQGIIDVVWFFLGILITIEPLSIGGWRLASSTLLPAFAGPYGRLGITTRLLGAPGGSWPYTFIVHVPVALTDEQREMMIQIIEAMKAAHEHYILDVPPAPVLPPWLLGVAGRGELGIHTTLGF